MILCEICRLVSLVIRELEVHRVRLLLLLPLLRRRLAEGEVEVALLGCTCIQRRRSAC